MITSLSELYLRIRRFIFLIQMKKVISMNYGSSTSSLLYSMRDIYINSKLNPLAKFTNSSRSTKFKDILPWNISQMIRKTIPIRTRIVRSYAMKLGNLMESQWKLRQQHDQNFPMEEKSLQNKY